MRTWTLTSCTSTQIDAGINGAIAFGMSALEEELSKMKGWKDDEFT